MSSRRIALMLCDLKMSTVLSIPQAFMPRKFIDVEKNP